MTQKKLPTPAWYKNTYFWIAAILFVLSIVGMPFLGGNAAIRDPGQKHENGLWLIYFLSAVVMLVNGLISHRMTVQHYQESQEATETK